MFNQLTTDVREMLHEQVTYRELLVQITRRDLMLRYKQTVMGFGWALFMPILNTIIFSTIFMRVAPIETPVAYPVFVYCGLVAWNFFAGTLRFAVNSLTSNTSLVTKVYFPREILPFSALLVGLVDFAIGALILIPLMIWFHVVPGPALAFLPVVLVVHIAFTAGVALLLAMANLFYRDVKYLFEVVLTIWMFASSVLYPTTQVGGRLATLLQLNPMTPIIDAYRAVILYGTLPPAGPFAGAAVAAFMTLGVGWYLFHRAEFQFAENV